MTLRFLSAGESHGPALIVILDGFPAGLSLAPQDFSEDMLRRQTGYGAGPRMKLEQDTVEITGGVMAGQTTGAPIALTIRNQDYSKWKGRAVEAMTAPRPGHADLGGVVKYGFADLRPSLERASARETAARVAMGCVCRKLLAEFGIRVGGYVVSIGEVMADLSLLSISERIDLARTSEVHCPDPIASKKMIERIRTVMDEKDTLGGVIEAAILGVPPGLGSFSQWDSRLESKLGAAILSIQAVKGIEIGPAFENSHSTGTSVQDAISLSDEHLVRSTNRAGGIEGGISTGEPILIRAAMKPIASTLTPQPTVDLQTGKEVGTRYERSDFCPVPRAVVVIEAMTAFVLADALLAKLGGDSLSEMRPRFAALRQNRLSDIHLDGESRIWWPE